MLFLQNMLSFVIRYLSLRESESSFGKVFTFEKAQPDLPPRGRGTARRRWKEFSPAVIGRRSLSPSPSTGFPRRSKPPVLPPIAYRGFALAPKPLRPLPKKLARPPAPVSPPQRPPSSREGDRPQAVEGVPSRNHRKTFPHSSNPFRGLGAIGLDIKKYRVSS